MVFVGKVELAVVVVEESGPSVEEGADGGGGCGVDERSSIRGVNEDVREANEVRGLVVVELGGEEAGSEVEALRFR